MRLLCAGKGEVVALGFTPGRSRLVAGYESAGIHVWDLASPEPLVGLRKHEYFRHRSFAFSPDGDRFYLARSGQRNAVDLATGETTPVGPPSSASLVGFVQSLDGNRLVLAHGPSYNPRVSGWHREGEWVEDWVRESGSGSLNDFAISPLGEWIAVFARRPKTGWPWSPQLSIGDARTGEHLTLVEYPYSYRSHLFFRPDGAQLVAVHEMTLLVWPVPGGGTPRYVRNDSRRHFTAAAFHPSNRYLFTTSNDETVLVWDTETWKPLTRFTWNIGRLRSVAMSPDGTIAAAGSDKGQIMVWDVDL